MSWNGIFFRAVEAFGQLVGMASNKCPLPYT